MKYLVGHMIQDLQCRDLKKYYWWPRMKREIAEYMAKCVVCQQVKGGTSATCKAITTVFYSRVEMGT